MRRGVSLLEVLFAIAVISIGVLGSMALLTVAGSQAKKGRTNDAVTALGPTAFHDFDARGYRQVQRWVAWNSTTNAWQQHTPSFGESICIDPRFMAANASNATAASIFPYTPAVGNQVRMRRITLNNGAGLPLGKLLADERFMFADDLAFLRDDDQSKQPSQLYDTLPTGERSRRQTEGQFSWLATLCPKIDRYAVGLNDQYVLSVVIFDQRLAGLDMSMGAERVCDVTFPGSGIMGGEVLLSSATVSLDVKSGDWLMLTGRSRQHDVNSDPMVAALSQPVPHFKWYRVSDTEADTTAGERYVSLIGPDWNMDTTDHQAVLVDGVIGVYEKTVRLE